MKISAGDQFLRKYYDCKPFPNYIAGTWVAGSDAAPNINPSDLNDTIGHYARGQCQPDRSSDRSCGYRVS